MITVAVPLQVPSLNVTSKMHWLKYQREKKMWQFAIWAVGQALIKSRNTPFTRITLRSYRKRLLDRDNLIGGAKMVIDAIRDLKWIVDDDPAHLTVEYVQEQRKPYITILEME